MNLDEIKAYRDASDARVSESGTTKEQRELLERLAGVDVLSTAIDLAEGLKRQLTEANREIEGLCDVRDRREQQIGNIVSELGSDSEWSNFCDLGDHAVEIAASMVAKLAEATASRDAFAAETNALSSALGGAPVGAIAQQVEALHRDLAEAQQLHSDVRALMIQYKDERDEAQADNAALIKMLDRTEEYVPKDSMEYGDAVMLLSQPHPGQALLAELDTKAKALDAIANLLPPSLPAPMPDLPPAWAEDQRKLYAAVETARAAKGGAR